MRSNKTVEAYNFDEVTQRFSLNLEKRKKSGAFPFLSHSSPLSIKHGDRTASHTFSQWTTSNTVAGQLLKSNWIKSLYFCPNSLSGKEWAPSSWATRGSLALSEGKECRKGGRCQYLNVGLLWLQCCPNLSFELFRFQCSSSHSQEMSCVCTSWKTMNQLSLARLASILWRGIRWHHPSIPR